MVDCLLLACLTAYLLACLSAYMLRFCLLDGILLVGSVLLDIKSVFFIVLFCVVGVTRCVK